MKTVIDQQRVIDALRSDITKKEIQVHESQDQINALKRIVDELRQELERQNFEIQEQNVYNEEIDRENQGLTQHIESL